jgi:serine/threonine-protein kinase
MPGPEFMQTGGPGFVPGFNTDDGPITMMVATSTQNMRNMVCVIQSGSVKCAGYNDDYNLGDGTRDSSKSFVPVMGLDSGVTAIAGTGGYFCAIKENEVWCWGTTSDPNAYASTLKVPTKVAKINTAKSIAVGSHMGCAILKDDTKLMCWDATTNDPATEFHGLPLNKAIQKVSMGSYQACVIIGGEVWCWGNNAYGELGNGTYTDSYTNSDTPVKAKGLSGVTDISLGTYFSCAIANGKAYCWGSDLVTTSNLTPTLFAGLDGVSKIAVGYQLSCAAGGETIKCWGSDHGGLGAPPEDSMQSNTKTTGEVTNVKFQPL